VIGHDWGGVHAWMLAGHPNKRLRSLAIVNSVHPKQWLRRARWPRQIAKSWYVGAFQLPYISEGLLWLLHGPIIKSIREQGWRAPAGDITMAEYDGAAINAVNQYRQLARDLPTFLREKPSSVSAPVLILASEGDRYLEEPSATEFADLASKVTVRVIKGKHWLHAEQPERINRILSEFWKEHS
jgi:pimeloyl-ACP methyl ester carboxylesterase